MYNEDIYIKDIYRTYTGHIQDIYRTYTGHIQDMYRTYTGHVQDIYRTCTYTGRVCVFEWVGVGSYLQVRCVVVYKYI